MHRTQCENCRNLLSSLHLLPQKLCEINVHVTERQCKLFSRNIFQVRENFSFSRIVQNVGISIFTFLNTIFTKIHICPSFSVMCPVAKLLMNAAIQYLSFALLKFSQQSEKHSQRRKKWDSNATFYDIIITLSKFFSIIILQLLRAKNTKMISFQLGKKEAVA